MGDLSVHIQYSLCAARAALFGSVSNQPRDERSMLHVFFISCECYDLAMCTSALSTDHVRKTLMETHVFRKFPEAQQPRRTSPLAHLACNHIRQWI